ncbi:hypothetical protein C4J81_18345 [Deltaproteobacteria bacterium Smac51]|nr:hypothetical protein C4J81_18345 [Deltaproteobacteria bacterium Smac51]
MNSTTLKRLPGSPGCFICDNNNTNDRALKLHIMWNDETQSVHIPFEPDQSWCGYSNVVHGGLIASVMDEGMAWVVKQKSGDWAFTADFHLRYKRPLEPFKKYVVVARTDEAGGRKIQATAEILDQEGRVAAMAEAVFLPSRQARPRTSE